MDIQQIIADNLNAWMAQHAKLRTNKLLASASGVGASTIQRIRKAEGNVTADNMAAIAMAFKRPPADLMLLPPTDGNPLTASEPDPQDYSRPIVTELSALTETLDDAAIQLLIDIAKRFSGSGDNGNFGRPGITIEDIRDIPMNEKFHDSQKRKI